MMTAPGPQLRDIHMPPPPPWWPPAPGWWLLAVLLTGVMVLLAWWLRRWRHRRRLLQTVLAELDHLKTADAATCAAGISQLMRRVARWQAPTDAAMPAAEWTALVRRHAPDAASAEVLEPLALAMYQRTPHLDTERLQRAARDWLRRAVRQGRGRA